MVFAMIAVGVMGAATWAWAATNLGLPDQSDTCHRATCAGEPPSRVEGLVQVETKEPEADTDSWGHRPEKIENPFVNRPSRGFGVESDAADGANIPRFRVTVRPAEHLLITESDRHALGSESAVEGAEFRVPSASEVSESPVELTTKLSFPHDAGGQARSIPPGGTRPDASSAVPGVPLTIPSVGPRRSAPASQSALSGQRNMEFSEWGGAPIRLSSAANQSMAMSAAAGGNSPASSAMAAPAAVGQDKPPLERPVFGYPNTCENTGYDPNVFIPNPNYACQPYDARWELDVYRGKFCVPAQGPWVELGRGLYRPGPLPPAFTGLTGETNPMIPHFLIFGDFRTALAYNDNGNGNEATVWANRLNLDFDWKITSTERIHAFWGPLDRGGRFTRSEVRDDNLEFRPELDNNFDTLFFEGDLGYIWGGMTNRWAPFDLPVTAGRFPLLYQNGTWLVDVLDGFAFNFPGKNSPLLDWPNFELTFFFALNNVTSPAFVNNSNVDLYGVQSFIEAYDGYLEVGYAYLNDRSGQDFSYHNLGISFTRRYFQRVSTSFRAIFNAGQDPAAGAQTADGQLFLWENAFVSRAPNYFVPYVNAFVGFDRPQSAARAAGTGGVLFNTGINFETDFLTDYPTLDATANNTWGGACGVNLLGPDYSWQLITEFATVQTFGQGGAAVGDQYAWGTRFQVPLSNAWLWRVDGIYGLRTDQDDLRGARTELRWKF